MLNGTFIQGFELDDYHQSAPLHSNAIVLPALLAAAQYNNRGTTSAKSQVTGADFLLATIVGYEVGPRVGLALNGGHMLSQGWHSGAVFGPSASAAAVSKLLELPPPMIEDALGTACTQACGLMSAQFESMVKRMHHGFASRSGLFAALMASEGYTGIKVGILIVPDIMPANIFRRKCMRHLTEAFCLPSAKARDKTRPTRLMS